MPVDVIILGAGIAGVSLGARLSGQCKVQILEMEKQPGYHSTGRSAAYFAPAYGNKVVREITLASEPFFRQPPDNFSETPLLHPRDSLFVAEAHQQPSLQQLVKENSHLVQLNAAQVKERVAIINTERIVNGVSDPTGGDLDVDAILQGYLKQFRFAGGELVTNIQIDKLERRNGYWYLYTDETQYKAPIIVNATGAWADLLASSAGVEPVGLSPLRRTAVLVDPPTNQDISSWPLTIDVDEGYYFKPDAGQILISPADETPSEPCDAQPEELDIAIIVDRIQQITDLDIKTINHSWAGLRTFSRDKSFVVGFDPEAAGFFWLAGQGGYGVQSCPALADLAAHLITGDNSIFSRQELTSLTEAVSPGRFL